MTERTPVTARPIQLRNDLDPGAIGRRVAHLNRAVPSALKEPLPSLIDEIAANEKDRHVLAVAVHTATPAIVTNNLRDFPQRLLGKHAVEAVSADGLLLDQIERDPEAVLDVIDAMAARRRRHP